MAKKSQNEDNVVLGEVTSTTYVLELNLIGGRKIPLDSPTNDLREVLRLHPNFVKILDQMICYRSMEIINVEFEWKGNMVKAATKPSPPSRYTFLPTSGSVITKEEAAKVKNALNDALLEAMTQNNLKALFITNEMPPEPFAFDAEAGDKVLTQKELDEIKSVLTEPKTKAPATKEKKKTATKPKTAIPVVADKNRKPFDYKNESAFDPNDYGDKVVYEDGRIVVLREKVAIE